MKFSQIIMSYGFMVMLSLCVSFGMGSQNLHGDLTRATVKAVQWLTQQETERIINPYNHGLLSASLKLVGYDKQSEVSCLKTNNNSLKKLLEPNVFQNLNIGGMAYVLIGVKASCYKQSSKFKWQLKMLRNKLRATSKLDCLNLFEYSLGVIAILVHNKSLPISIANKAIFKSVKNCTSLDVRSMFALSLHAITKQKLMYNIQQKSSKFKLVEVLNGITKKYNNKEIKDNIYGFSILAQVLAERQHSSLYYRHFLKRIQKGLLQLQLADGSFGNLITTIHVLPALATTGLVELMDFECDTSQEKEGIELASEPIKRINVTYQINIPNKVKVMDHQVNISVESGLTAFDGLTIASTLEPCYEHKYVNTDWGKHVKEICKYYQSDKDQIYWLYYVNSKSATTGLDSYELKDGDVITFSYGTLNFRTQN